MGHPSGVRVEILADVHVTAHDGLEGGLVDAQALPAQQAGLEEHLGAAEPLRVQVDEVPVGQLLSSYQDMSARASGVGLAAVAGRHGLLHLRLEVQRHVA